MPRRPWVCAPGRNTVNPRAPAPRIFLSSVIDGYNAFRNAAATGITGAQCLVVRSEDFPAASTSPRTACLDAVRSADGIVLLLGANFGYETPSGRSVTGEEYEEAKRCHKRIWVFVEDGVVCEPRQAEFVRRVQGYIGGHWRKTFSGSDELANLVTCAIRDAHMSVSPSDTTADRISAALEKRPRRAGGIVWLHGVWATARDEEVIDPLHFSDRTFQRNVQRVAHEAELFSYEQGSELTVGPSSLRVHEGKPERWSDARDLLVVDLTTDGVVSIASNVTGVESRRHVSDTLVDMYYILTAVVARRLAAAWRFVSAWWSHVDPYDRHDPLEYAVALHDVGARYLEKRSTMRGSGLTVPETCPTNPVLAFDRPRRIARAGLRHASGEIDRVVTLLQRRFAQWDRRARG